jgi:DNA invertase Pin-like site-specific DNA recombinase
MPTPAAQYLRMSTDLQQYSLVNQAAAIEEYAQQHSFTIVETYVDSGRSGLLLKQRPGLQRLLAEAMSGKPNYKAILVYDVSRWGRFQDIDESAHYEFLCRSVGIPIYYCAEPFPNDGTISSSILKTLKRSMAAEYSRELGVKTYAGKRRLAQLGFRVGGQASFGLRRMMLSSDAKQKQILEVGQYKNLTTDRVILVPGPETEVACVRQIYQMALRMRYSAIVRELNARNVPFLDGKPWTWDAVQEILTNPKYAGCNVWGRTTSRLRARTSAIPPEKWVVRPEAFQAVVDQRTFDRVQAAHERQKAPMANKKLLRKLKHLLDAKGRLSEQLISKARGMPSKTTYAAHFGGLRRAYELVGYRESSRQVAIRRSLLQTSQLRETLLAHIVKIFPDKVQRQPGNNCAALRLQDGLLVSILIARSYETKVRHQSRWKCFPSPARCNLVTLLCLANPSFDGFLTFYVMPGINVVSEYRIKGERDPWLGRGERLDSLSDLCLGVNKVVLRMTPRHAEDAAIPQITQTVGG